MTNYEVVKQSTPIEAMIYRGYINGGYAGNVTGFSLNDNTFEIRHSNLEERFQGTMAVRAWREIIKGIEKDYKYIVSRIDNKDNAEIKIVLSSGFHIVGTKTYKDEIAVEILKIRED